MNLQNRFVKFSKVKEALYNLLLPMFPGLRIFSRKSEDRKNEFQYKCGWYKGCNAITLYCSILIKEGG